MDGQMDGQKEGHTDVGPPPKKRKEWQTSSYFFFLMLPTFKHTSAESLCDCICVTCFKKEKSCNLCDFS